MKRLSAAAGIVSLLFPTFAPAAEACTGIFLKATDGSVVHARTLEFALDLDSEVIVVPRGFARRGDTPDGKAGLEWTTKYASVGANGAGLPYIFDGLNEKGLAVGLFYFPGTAGYMPYTAADAAKTMAPWQIGSWLLETAASVDEARAAVAKIVLPAVVLKAWGFAPPVHYIVHDASGKSIVIEYVGGKLTVSDNPLGVITNSPAFDWHMTNLRNYLNFSIYNAPPVMLGKVKLEPLGQGSGMLGIPGDFTPPSRFVRAVAFTQSILESATGGEAVLEAFHILNNFDIPKGAARDEKKDAQGNVVADYTLWTSANDLKARRFYIRTRANSQIRSVDLMKMNLDAKDIVKFSIKGQEVIKPLVP
ncbi:MAG: choloylglycine hydrolase family protein [Reyranella sp.]|nr:MAG: choloylglycine hydrolase family protein [Reyranella sp.]